MGREGALVCSAQVDTSSIQWVDFDGKELDKESTGVLTLDLPLGIINDTLYGTRYTCIVTSTGANQLMFEEDVIIVATGKSCSGK